MLHGPHPSMVYQYAFSVTLALVAGALSTQDPSYAAFTRIVLTLIGAFTAAFAVAGLDMITNWNETAPEASAVVTMTSRNIHALIQQDRFDHSAAAAAAVSDAVLNPPQLVRSRSAGRA